MIDGKDSLERQIDDFALAEEVQVATIVLDNLMKGEQPEPVVKAAALAFTKITHDAEKPAAKFPVITPALNDDILAQVDDVTPVLNKVFADTDLEIQFPGLLELSSNAEGERNFRKIHDIPEDAPATKPFVSLRVTPELHKAAGGNLRGTGTYQGRRYTWQLVGAGTHDEHIQATWI